MSFSKPGWPECFAAQAAMCGALSQSQVSSPPKPKCSSGNSGAISDSTLPITSKVRGLETSACEKFL